MDHVKIFRFIGTNTNKMDEEIEEWLAKKKKELEEKSGKFVKIIIEETAVATYQSLGRSLRHHQEVTTVVLKWRVKEMI